MRCPRCQQENPSHATFCLTCGAPVDGAAPLPKSYADLKGENEELRRALGEAHAHVSEALARETATGDILRVIGSSPTDAQPVFETIARSGLSVCAALGCVVFVVDGEMLRVAATAGVRPERVERFRGEYPIPLSAEIDTARIVRDRRIVHLADIANNPNATASDVEYARLAGYRTRLMVPVVRGDRALGLIAVTREDPSRFPDHLVELLRTFAEQAAIAIENVRLFTELQTRHRDLTQALDRQTATADVLRIIAQSPTELQPVLDAIAMSAVRLCAASDAVIERLEGDRFYNAAHAGTQMKGLVGLPLPLTRGFPGGRAVLDRKPVIIDDVQLVLESEFPDSIELHKLNTIHSVAEIPMLSEGRPLGSLAILRAAVRPFTDAEVALLRTFADQAVIAIENVRLFNELGARNAELTAALDQQTATSEILGVISRSPTDVQPIFDAIVQSASRLCGGEYAIVTRYDGSLLHLAALYNPRPGTADDTATFFPQVPRREESPTARAFVDADVVHIPDVEADDWGPSVRARHRRIRLRAIVAVPMLHEGRPIGVISVSRETPGPFSERQVALLKTFADQAVIAIENARLYTELEQKGRALEAASRHKSEFLANMSHELRTPLNAVIGFSEVLTERMFGDLNEKQDDYLKDIHASGQHLLSLINDILDLSKIEAGRMELELTDFHLPQAIENALVLVRERALRRAITLEQTIDPRLGEIRGDERKLKQVLLNLLSNAIKFTPDGGRINVRAVPRDAKVEVSVSDTGVGIAPADQEVIFEEFRQVGTAAKKVEGTGLGLTLSRKFIELHGGRIRVESQLGTGSTFTFTIPVRREG
jgi:signal transduction histidine kinase